MSIPYEWMACVKSGSVPTLEGIAKQLDGDYKKRTDPVRKCYEAAKERGWSLFTLSDGGACNSGPDIIYTYGAKGELEDCMSEKGGDGWADVYAIIGKQLVSYEVLHFTV